MTDKPNAHAVLVHALDQLDGAVAELDHWLRTGERAICVRCAQKVPAAVDHTPVRHQLRGEWCVDEEEVDR